MKLDHLTKILDTRTGLPYKINEGELVGWRRGKERLGVPLRQLHINLQDATPWLAVEKYYVHPKELRRFLKSPERRSRKARKRDRQALRAFLRTPFQVVNVINGPVSEELLDLLVNVDDVARGVKVEARRVAVRLALDRAMWPWLSKYLAARLPEHLERRFDVASQDAVYEAAVREARFLRYGLHDRTYMQREIHRVLGDILPKIEVTKLIMPRVHIPSCLSRLQRSAPIQARTYDRADERTVALLQRVTAGLPDEFRHDCELLLAGVGFREQARLSGEPEASFATLWRRKWRTELDSLALMLDAPQN